MGCEVEKPKKSWDNTVDKIFSKAGDKLNDLDKHNIFTTTSLRKEFSRVTTEYQAALNEIYDNAAEVHKYLEKDLLQEESVDLIKALGGDLDPINLPDHLKPLYENLRAKIDKNADDLVKAGALHEKSKIKDYLKRYYKQHQEEKDFFSKIYFSQKFKKRKDLTHDERVALGMIEDASIVVSKTLAEQRVQLLKASVLKTIADKYGSNEPKDGYVQISDASNGGGIKKYGALAGKYVPEEILQDIKHSELAKETMGVLEKYWYPVIDHVKVNVTVKNPVTHLYNIGSNIMLASLNGDLISLGKVLHMKVKEPKKFEKLLKKANKHGLNSSLRDFEDMTAVIEGGKTNVAKSILKNLYLTKGSKAGDKIRKLYDWEDKIFKLAAYYKLLKKGVPDSEAFAKASEVYVDYSTPLPATVRTMDKSGLFPFLHYVYKATPATAKVIAKHPIRYMMLQTALIGTGASAWLSNNDDDLKPEWGKDQYNLFGAKEWVGLGNSWYLNLGRALPGMKFGGIDLSMDTGFGFVGGLVNIAAGKTPLGYNISGQYDPGYVKAGEKLLTMAENYLPPLTFGRYGQRFSKKALGIEQKNYYKEDMTYTELAGRGIGVRRFNEEAELKKKMKKAKNKKKYKDKNNPGDKTTHQKEYNDTARRLKDSAKTAKINLSEKKSDFKLPKFKF